MIVSPFLKKWYSTYSNKTHFSTIEGLEIETLPGVFSPYFFLSTKTFIQFLKSIPLFNDRLLELGCGTGTISVWAAMQGAVVTATDINPKAIENTLRNAELNNIIVKTKLTSLFEGINLEEFEIVIINPPYYPKKPRSLEENAWFCGENFEYFNNLFTQLSIHMYRCTVYMILSEDCDNLSISTIAKSFGLTLQLAHTSNRLIEKEFIYQIISRQI